MTFRPVPAVLLALAALAPGAPAVAAADPYALAATCDVPVGVNPATYTEVVVVATATALGHPGAAATRVECVVRSLYSGYTWIHTAGAAPGPRAVAVTTGRLIGPVVACVSAQAWWLDGAVVSIEEDCRPLS